MKVLWNEERQDYLRRNYAEAETSEIARHLGCSKRAVISQACKLGCSKSRCSMASSEAGEQFIRANWGKLTNAAIAERLGCSIRSVQIAARKLSLDSPPARKPRRDQGKHRHHVSRRDRIDVSSRGNSTTDEEREGYDAEQVAFMMAMDRLKRHLRRMPSWAEVLREAGQQGWARGTENLSKVLCSKCLKILKNDAYGNLCEDCWADQPGHPSHAPGKVVYHVASKGKRLEEY